MEVWKLSIIEEKSKKIDALIGEIGKGFAECAEQGRQISEVVACQKDLLTLDNEASFSL